MKTTSTHTLGLLRSLALLAAVAIVPACDKGDTVIVQQGGAASSASQLSGLTVSPGTLSPAFSPDVLVYSVVGVRFSQLTVTPTAADPGATVLVNGIPVPSGTASAAQALPQTFTVTSIEIAVIPPGLFPSRSYFLVVERPYLKASNTGTDDQFGFSVALSGDTLVVGAYQEDSSATGINGNQADNSAADSGAAYVFRRSGGTWIQEAYLKASNAEAGDWFGRSVAISGDTIIVGASLEDSAATGVGGNQADNTALVSGAAYVFRRTGTVWAQEAYLKASNTEAVDVFGWSVAVSGDSAVVGAFGEDSSATGVGGNQADNGATESGAAYVFRRTGTVWAQEAYLKASNTEIDDVFGNRVAIDGDAIVVGAGGEDGADTGVNGNEASNGAAESGAAYVFRLTGPTWAQEAYVKPSITPTGLFGASLALVGDVLVVGAPGQDIFAVLDIGAAYVFRRTLGVWAQEAELSRSFAAAGDQYGSSVALSGDTIVVGALGQQSAATGVNGDQADTNAPASGAAYTIRLVGAQLFRENYLKAANPGFSDFFGSSVAVSGDTIVIGAPGEASAVTGVNGNQADNTAPGSGAVYVFQ